MRRNNKKGFTIVELVIVIAVIVVLAAVLIPTFASIIKKADTSADVQMVRNLNTIVAAETTVNGGEISPHGAIVAVGENGYKVEKITPTSDGRTIVWDATNYRFALLDEDGKEIYPKDDKSGTPKANLFVISASYPAEDYDGYAVYLTDGYTGDYTLKDVETGVDVGYNDLITGIVYTGTGEVAIRGNEHTTIQVDNGIVHHYDTALTAYVNDPGQYVEHGKLLVAQSEGTIPDTATTGFAGGEGTAENPYLIASNEQFLNIAKFSNTPTYFKLVDDVTYSGNYISTYFVGEFDGNGHTITNTSTDTSGPCLFYASNSSKTKITTVKNLTYEIAGIAKPFFFSSFSGIVFENITIKGADPDEIYQGVSGVKAGLLLCTNAGGAVFRNCVNEMNVNFSDASNGLFLGNMADGYGWETYVFDGCINRGIVTGKNVGFFCGQNYYQSGYPILVDDPNYTFTDAKKAEIQALFAENNWYVSLTNKGAVDQADAVAYYINNCANEGVMIGTASCSPYPTIYRATQDGMGSGVPSLKDPSTGNWTINGAYLGEHANAFNSAIVTSGAFKKGIMVESSINDIGITAADGKIGITASADTHVTEYKVTLSVGIGYENGNGGLLVDYIVTADSAGSFEAPFVVKGISAAEYDETASTKFADLSGKQTGTNGLVYAIVGDTIVVDLSSGNSSANRVGSQTSYYLYAFNAEGQTIGSVTYINCNGLK